MNSYRPAADSGLHEACGVFAAYSSQQQDFNAASMAYYGLYALQHRGQEACGIAVASAGAIRCHKDSGLVSEVFNSRELAQYPPGNITVGHVRYGTTGSSERSNAQPIVVRHTRGVMALSHNGNLVNASELRQQLEMNGSIFHSSTDSEIIAHVINQEALHHDIEEAVSRAMPRLHGAYALAIMTESKLIAVRDAHGFRPLCYGRTAEGIYVVASESCALDAVGATFIRDLLPGEILIFDSKGVHTRREHCNSQPHRLCVFEFIYFARPDSIIEGSSVHEARLRAGAFLAQQHPVEADVVIGVPDSGIDAAIGYARASGIPFGNGLLKNKYIGRTFISPTQSDREDKVRIKLNPVPSTIRNKRVVMVDDSIVRGTTCARIVRLLREAGAKEVHMRVSAPPFLYPCFYGTDIDSSESLIAYQHTLEEIRQIIGADSLGYLSLENAQHLAQEIADKHADGGFCTACFSGDYPTATPLETSKIRFE